LLDLAEIFTGIDNLAERCETKYSLSIKDLTLSEKLDVIQVKFNTFLIIIFVQTSM
jgi:hypothetical protein